MFRNPNYVKPEKVRFEKYKVYIAEFIGQLPPDKEIVTFQEVRDYFAGHSDPVISALVPDMTDGVLEDLAQQYGLERVPG